MSVADCSALHISLSARGAKVSTAPNVVLNCKSLEYVSHVFMPKHQVPKFLNRRSWSKVETFKN